MKIHVDETKQDTKLPQILEAALKLFVVRGIDGTSVKEIAIEAKVADGALYRHFKSKEELAWHLFAVNLKEYTASLLGTVLAVRNARDRVRLFVEESLAACERNPTLFYYLILSEHRELTRFTEDYLHPGKLIEQLVAEGQASGELRGGDRWVLFSTILGGVHRLCILRSRGLVTVPLTELAGELSETIWRSVRA